jgi:hypothetical protein
VSSARQYAGSSGAVGRFVTIRMAASASRRSVSMRSSRCGSSRGGPRRGRGSAPILQRGDAPRPDLHAASHRRR